jgi:hypothetical protein
MLGSEILEDTVWNQVVDFLSRDGRLGRFYKLAGHELQATLKRHGSTSNQDLSQLFRLLSQGQEDAAHQWLSLIGEARALAMLHCLTRGTRCWIETESPVVTIRSRWRVANG